MEGERRRWREEEERWREEGAFGHLCGPSSGEGGVKQLRVEVEGGGHQKRFLGGYRHQLTGAEFHHAAVQTLPKKRPDRGVELFCRDTQVGTAPSP